MQSGLTSSFCSLPMDILLTILDQLVGTPTGHLPVAYEASHCITKTLHALILVSRQLHNAALPYLYSHCLCIQRHTSFTHLVDTLAVNSHASQSKLQYIVSAVMMPEKPSSEFTSFFMQWPQLIGLLTTIGLNLRRLVLELPSNTGITDGADEYSSRISTDIALARMQQLEEMVVSDNVTKLFHIPPTLKRLAIVSQELKHIHDFCLTGFSLQTLVFIRPSELSSSNIELFFSSFEAQNLDVLLVDVNSNHHTPSGTRSWDASDTINFWEVDVATSFYGDEDDLKLCNDFMWLHGIRGTLWSRDKRRMASWADVEKRLAGPIHVVLDGVWNGHI